MGSPSITTGIRLLVLIASSTIQQISAQPTLNQDAPEYGPNDRFTEGTKIKTLFNQIDLNGDKKLDKHEVHLYFQKQGVPVQDGLWEREDKNGDGVIEIHEFARHDEEEL